MLYYKTKETSKSELDMNQLDIPSNELLSYYDKIISAIDKLIEIKKNKRSLTIGVNK